MPPRHLWVNSWTTIWIRSKIEPVKRHACRFWHMPDVNRMYLLIERIAHSSSQQNIGKFSSSNYVRTLFVGELNWSTFTRRITRPILTNFVGIVLVYSGRKFTWPIRLRLWFRNVYDAAIGPIRPIQIETRSTDFRRRWTCICTEFEWSSVCMRMESQRAIGHWPYERCMRVRRGAAILFGNYWNILRLGFNGSHRWRWQFVCVGLQCIRTIGTDKTIETVFNRTDDDWIAAQPQSVQSVIWIAISQHFMHRRCHLFCGPNKIHQRMLFVRTQTHWISRVETIEYAVGRSHCQWQLSYGVCIVRCKNG